MESTYWSPLEIFPLISSLVACSDRNKPIPNVSRHLSLATSSYHVIDDPLETKRLVSS